MPARAREARLATIGQTGEPRVHAITLRATDRPPHGPRRMRGSVSAEMGVEPVGVDGAPAQEEIPYVKPKRWIWQERSRLPSGTYSVPSTPKIAPLTSISPPLGVRRHMPLLIGACDSFSSQRRTMS